MFKSLGKSLRVREAQYIQKAGKTEKITKAVRAFTLERYGETLPVQITYDPKNDSLVLQADSKAVASELSILLPELIKHLKAENVQIKQIIIR